METTLNNELIPSSTHLEDGKEYLSLTSKSSIDKLLRISTEPKLKARLGMYELDGGLMCLYIIDLDGVLFRGTLRHDRESDREYIRKLETNSKLVLELTNEEGKSFRKLQIKNVFKRLPLDLMLEEKVSCSSYDEHYQEFNEYLRSVYTMDGLWDYIGE